MFIKSENVTPKILDAYTTRKVLGTGDEIMMVEVAFKKGGVGAAHSHSEHEQVSYVLSGSFEVTVGDTKQVLKTGDCFLAKKNVLHGVVALEDGALLDVFNPIRKDFL